MRALTWFLAVFSIIATLLPFIETTLWWVRIFDFPRVQIAIICLLAFLLSVRYISSKPLYKITIATILSACFIYQLSHIIVYTSIYPVQTKMSNDVKDKNRFSLMVSNVLMSNEETTAFKQQVYQYRPDILLITEPNQRWADELADLDTAYAYSIKRPLENTYGMLLYSKFPLEDEQVNFLVEKDVPSFFAKVKLPSGNRFDFYGIHPKPPKPGKSSEERDTEILIVGKKIREQQRSALVAGDLNDVGWSATTKRFQKYSRLGDPRQGRGLFNTYNAHLPLLRYPLDHIFYSDDFGLIDIKKLDNTGSDHFPMYIELSYEPAKDNIKELPDIDSGDKEIIKEKIGNE